jgi:branched-chain amino acid transport system ATP-binding protein
VATEPNTTAGEPGAVADETTGPLLRAQDVEVNFSGVKALAGVSFEVAGGEIVGLIGPNGSGKTTLLNVLSGYLVPTSGTVHVRGANSRGWPPERVARSGIARTFQGVRPFGRMTVEQNVELGAIGVGASRREARERAGAIMEQLGLTDVATRWANTLPAGSQRRLGIARALASKPDVLLLDEPAAGLYEAETDSVIEFIAQLRRSTGVGIGLVEHDMRVIMRLCDRVQVLDNGRTLAAGSSSEVRADPRVLEAYLGTKGNRPGA